MSRRLPVLVVLGLAFLGITCAPQGNIATKPQDGVVKDNPKKPAIMVVSRSLKERIEAALEHVQKRDLLLTHGFWTIFHGILGMGFETTLFDDQSGKRVKAIEHIREGGFLRGLRFIPMADGLEVETAEGGAGMFIRQGHQDQFIAEMIQWGMPGEQKFKVSGKDYTFLDFCRFSKARASTRAQPKQELSWAIIVVGQFYGTDCTWVNNRGEKLTYDEVVRYELNEPIEEGAACGGTHRLFGLTWAYHLHMSRGGKKTGVWKDVADKIDYFKKKAREYQNADSSFSTKYLGGKENQKDQNTRIGTTGHVLEWLAFAMTDAELREPWVQDAVSAMCLMILERSQADIDGGSLYHATHGLHIYRDRVFGTPNRAGGPVILLPPKE